MEGQCGTFIYAANRIPEISDTVVEIDNAMKWGYNFDLGPFETWDAIGVKDSVAKMEKEGLKVPENVKKMLKKGAASFYKLEKGKKMFYDFAAEGYKEVKIEPQGPGSCQLQGREKDRADHAFLLTGRHRRRRVLPRVPLQDERQ